MNRLKLLLFCVGIALLPNLLFWNGNLNSDYFSFRYVAAGVIEGQDAYRDFADNKGPFHYLVYILMELLFSWNRTLGLVVFGAVLVGLTTYFSILCIENFRIIKNRQQKLLMAVAGVIYLSSFMLGPVYGGIFAGNVAMLFLVVSIYSLLKNWYLASGVLLSIGLFSRPSVVYFGLFYLVFFIFKRVGWKNFVGFCLGGISMAGLVFGYFYLKGTLVYLIDNLIWFNLGYGQTVSENKMVSIPFLLGSPFAGIGLLFVLGILALMLERGITCPKARITGDWMLGISLLVSSLLAVFAAGIIFHHHLYQVAVMVFISWGILWVTSSMPRRNLLFTIGVVGMLVAGGLSLFSYWQLSYKYGDRYKMEMYGPVLKEIEKRPYMVVFPGFTEYYFYYDKKAPDRNFQHYYVVPQYLQDNERYVQEHIRALKPVVGETSFLFVLVNDFHQQLQKSYLELLGDAFSFEKVEVVEHNGITYEVYFAKKTEVVE